jgi:hypothetical protein
MFIVLYRPAHKYCQDVEVRNYNGGDEKHERSGTLHQHEFQKCKKKCTVVPVLK